MDKWCLRLVLLVTASSMLAACNREAQPSVSAVGLWQGTLTTMTGGSGTQPFTAEITAVDAEYADYTGVFTVGDTVYDVSGSYDGNDQNGERFAFNASPPELQAAVSDPFPYGFNWLGFMTETEYAGSWHVYEYPNRERSSEGTFSLERVP